MKPKLLIIGLLAVGVVLLYAWSDFMRSLNAASKTLADALPLGDKLHLSFANLKFILGMASARPTLAPPATTPPATGATT